MILPLMFSVCCSNAPGPINVATFGFSTSCQSRCTKALTAAQGTLSYFAFCQPLFFGSYGKVRDKYYSLIIKKLSQIVVQTIGYKSLTVNKYFQVFIIFEESKARIKIISKLTIKLQ